MGLYVNISDACKEDAERQTKYDAILRLKEQVQQDQSLCRFDNFPPPFLKKRFERQIRLLADYRTVHMAGEDHVVVNFLRVFIRGNKEYESFLRDTVGFGAKYLTPLVSQQQLEGFLKGELEERPIPSKDIPSDEESDMLYRLLGGDLNRNVEEFVCESERWMCAVGNKRVRDRLVLIGEAVTKIADEKPNDCSRKVRDYEIVYRWFPALNKLFLAGLCTSADERDQVEQAYGTLLTSDATTIDEELLLRNSARAYPSILLADEDAWMDIQKDGESNLALSPEETTVLESVHSQEGGYPIFINGRAGSGKSTILYYLFADYVNLYLDLKSQGREIALPLLLSCSGELRRQAEQTVGNLIACNSRWRQSGDSSPQPPGDCFQEFQVFLLSLVVGNERTTRFDPKKYVGFGRFRQMWSTRFEKMKVPKNLGPDVSWHVIRTYIKGTNSEDYLEPDEYVYLPRKQKTVSQETFSNVHEIVWEGWYREQCDQQGYWDDQDLARFVLDEGLVQPRYSAVFCDEAQDFTRVELNLIFRLCLFTDRRLRHEDIRRVPFAFAGDPFQTLNPTGFRWDAIQALYHDKLLDTLGGSIYKQLEMNYKELSLNYRSTANVVRLCNLVQAFRAAVFDIPSLRPQETWQMERSSPMPVWFDRKNTAEWKRLGEERDITIIVPCMLDEEQFYVSQDEHLAALVQTDDDGVPVNVLSPARAKGLEFERVALYGFAAAAPVDLLGLLDQEQASCDQLLPYEYFVNQLYVAVSRPKRRLFIIEDQQGRDRLWKLANDRQMQEKMWTRLRKGEAVWADHVGGFEIGTAESWSEDRGNEGDNAVRFEQQGMASRDPFFLRSAAVSYGNLGKSPDAERCRAYAHRFEEKHREAGESFRKAGMADEAIASFWNAGFSFKDEVRSLHSEFPDIGSRIEYQLMEVLNDPSIKRVEFVLLELESRAQDDVKLASRIRTEAAFNYIIRNYVDSIVKTKPDEQQARGLLAVLDPLLLRGLPPEAVALGELYFRAGQYRKAVSTWEADDKQMSSANYKSAKTALLLEDYENDSRKSFTPVETELLASEYSRRGDYLESLRVRRSTYNANELVGFMAKVSEDYDQWRDLIIECVRALIQVGEWGQIVSLGNASVEKNSRAVPKNLMVRLKRRSADVRDAIVAVCANSDEFAAQNSRLLREYSTYFNEALISSSQWRESLSAEAVGAAIERSGRQIDALRFYEQVLESPQYSRSEKEFARQRWIATKEKQGARSSDEGKEDAAARYMKEAGDKRREYGLQDARIPDLPAAQTLWARNRTKVSPTETLNTPSEAPVATATERDDSTPSQSDPISLTTCEVNGLRFEFSQQHGRVNITHVVSQETASIQWGKRRMHSGDVEITSSKGRFSCADWALECWFDDRKELPETIVHMESLGLKLVFSIPPTVE